jgi:serine/threonine protein kinase
MKQIWKQRYQIREKLGKGSNGQVYQVWDLHLEKFWAMKEMEHTMEDELQVLKRINHPLFPRIVDAFREEDRNFLVMDYVRGITLEEALKRGPLEEKAALAIAIQLTRAVGYLHQMNPPMLYLDLKPANIMLEEEGRIKLVDLGSVMVKGQCGRVSGTFGYASPEQVMPQKEGSALKEQSDIYSLGMVMFAMVTGKTDILPVMEGEKSRGFWVRKYNPLISPRLEHIIEQCTRRKAESRYSGMRELEQELEKWEKKLAGKRRVSFLGRWGWRCLFSGEEWQQQKSILCASGKSSLYIAGRLVVLSLSLAWLLPGLKTYAGEEKGALNEQNAEVLSVVIRDRQWRKVLVKKDSPYLVEEGILLEIPREMFSAESGQLVISCAQDGGENREYRLLWEKK